MNKADVAKNIANLSTLMCISVEEAWEHHTDQGIKDRFSLDEIKQCLSKGNA